MDNKKSVTIKNIAAMCGVGIGTVSRAINNQPGVKKEVRSKILGYINDIGWKRNNIIERLSSFSNGKLIVFLAARQGLFARHTDNDMIEMLLERCELQRFETILLLGNRKESLIQCAKIKPHAVIQLGHIDALQEQELQLLKQNVRLINLTEDENFNGVMLHPDHFEAGQDMARTLRRAGHRKIGFLGGFGSLVRITPERLPTLRLRVMLAGVKAVHPEFNFADDAVSDNYGDSNPIVNALKTGQHTAWICDEQRSCALLLHAARSLGLRIPEDFSLITISPEQPFYLYPLDVSRCVIDLEGRCSKVMELLNIKSFPNHDEYKFPHRLHRGTTIQKLGNSHEL